MQEMVETGGGNYSDNIPGVWFTGIRRRGKIY